MKEALILSEVQQPALKRPSTARESWSCCLQGPVVVLWCRYYKVSTSDALDAPSSVLQIISHPPPKFNTYNARIRPTTQHSGSSQHHQEYFP